MVVAIALMIQVGAALAEWLRDVTRTAILFVTVKALRLIPGISRRMQVPLQRLMKARNPR